MVVGPNGKLEWNGTIYITENIWKGLARNAGEDGVAILREILLDIHVMRRVEGLENLAYDFSRLCEIFWNAVTHYAKFGQIDVIHFINDRHFGSFDFCESETFIVNFLEHVEEYEQHGLAHYMRDLREQLGLRGMKEITKQLTLYFEEHLYQSMDLVILYPVRSGNQKYKVILPFFGSAEDNYVHSSAASFYRDQTVPEKQAKIRAVYKLAYEKMLPGDHCNEDILNTALVEITEDSRRKFELNDSNYLKIGDLICMVSQAAYLAAN